MFKNRNFIVLQIFSGFYIQWASFAALESKTLLRYLRNHEVKNLHCGAGGRGDRGGFRWAEVDSHASCYFMIFVFEIDLPLAFHKVQKLVLGPGIGLECFSRFQPAQRPKDILSTL